jgi:hypothetical protein
MDKVCECQTLQLTLGRPAYNMGFSAMLAEEYILGDISLIGCVMVRLFFATSLKFIQHRQLYLSLVTGLT